MHRRLLFAALVSLCYSASALAVVPACHGPQDLESQVHSHPSARTWGALGGWYGERKNYACAISAFQAAIQLEPSSARLYYFLGLSLYSTGKVQDSIPEFRRSVELDPQNLQAELALGVAYHQLGNIANADAAWQTALAVDPNSVTALDWLAKARIAERQYAAAVELLSHAPPDEDLILDLALAYSQSGQFEKATDTLTTALAQTPEDVRLRTALAAVYVQSHRYQDATNLIRATLNAHPEDGALEILYLRLLVLQDDDTDAQPIAKRILAAHPHDFDSLYLSGIIENDQQEYAAAAENLHAASMLGPNNYDVRLNLGKTYAHLKQYDSARLELEKAAVIDPMAAEAHFQLAQVLRVLNQLTDAQAQFKLFQQCKQTTITLALGQTKAGQAAQSLKDGNATQAVSLYREAIDALPEDAVLQYDLALALEKTGDIAAERAALERAVQLKPEFAEAENHLGLVMARAGETASAERHFRKAIAAAPGFAEAFNNLGTLLGQQGKDREAETCFRSAVAADPRFVEAWINLSATFASESKFAEARSAVDSALRIDANNQDAFRLREMLLTAQSKSAAQKQEPIDNASARKQE